jgi:hypothetical protein
MKNKTLAHTLIASALAVCGALIIILSFNNNGLCIIKKIFGFSCPFCGMTRAYKAFFSGEMQTALNFNPAFLLPPVSLFTYIAALISKKHKGTFFAIFFISAAIILLVWCLRILMGTTV